MQLVVCFYLSWFRSYASLTLFRTILGTYVRILYAYFFVFLGITRFCSKTSKCTTYSDGYKENIDIKQLNLD